LLFLIFPICHNSFSFVHYRLAIEKEKDFKLHRDLTASVARFPVAFVLPQVAVFADFLTLLPRPP